MSEPWLCLNYVDIIDLIMDVHTNGMTHGSGYNTTRVLIDVRVCLYENGLCKNIDVLHWQAEKNASKDW